MSLKEVPSVDFHKLEELDLEQDIQAAVNNNTDVIEARHTAAKGMAAASNKNRTLEELEETVKLQVRQFYEAVFQAKKAYDAASVGFEAANLTWSGSQIQFSAGMLSRPELLEQEALFLEKKTGLKTAELDLFQALQVYEWAVKGIIAAN